MADTPILLDRQRRLPPLQDKPLCLLSLDGGGIRGLSQLLILQEIFHRLQKMAGVDKPILPAEVFHMIGGTSTGGLVTILLGRLRLTMDEALECYTAISRKVFLKKKMLWQDGKFKASELERVIKETIEQKLGKGHANDLIRFPEESQKMCKSFVCAMASNHINKVPTLFRTWESSKDPGYNCQIWEAARATSAAPRLFKQILIGHPGRQVAYTDGALGCNNPVKYVISEASNEFGENKQIGCILSIGTGGRRTPRFDRPTGLQQLVPIRLIHVLARLATDGEEVCRNMEERFHDFPHLYQRLNAGQELGSVGLNEWERLGEIEAHTAAYLRKEEVQSQIDVIAEALMGFAGHSISSANFRYSAPRNLSLSEAERYYFFPDPWNNAAQHLHGESMNLIDQYFCEAGSHTSSKTLVLYGMAGAGKTQLVLRYCRRARDSGTFKGVVWIDGSSRATADDSLVRTAREMFPASENSWTGPKACDEISKTMESSTGPWLIVLDNYDDPAAYTTSRVIPQRSRGQLTMITSRSTDTTRLGIPVEIGELHEDEALKLLRQNSAYFDLNCEDNQSQCRSIVKRLGYLALAIAQASAYISDRHMDLDGFLTEYEEERTRILAALPAIWMYRRASSSVEQPELPLSIHTTWELSLNILTGDPVLRNAKVKLLSLSAFLGRAGISQDLFARYMECCDKQPEWMDAFKQVQTNRIDKYVFRDAITEMGRLCLLQKYQSNSHSISWQFHPVVQDWAMHRHSREEYEALANLALDVVLHSMSEMQSTWLLEDDYEDTQNHLGLTSHVLACYDNWQRMPSFLTPGKIPGGHMSALKFAKFFCNEGNYGIAQRIQRRILDKISPEDPLWSMAMRQLARTLFRQGEWLEAAQIQERVVSKLVPGVEDLDGAFQLTELAYMYQWPSLKVENHGDQMARASHLALRGYEAITRLEGTNSLAAASAMIVLAEISYHSKEYAKARVLETRAVAIRESRLGSANLSTVQAKNALAVTLAKLGQYAEAEMIHQDVRTFHLHRFGLHHPKTLEAERMLARDWRMGGKLGQARVLNEDILNRAIFSFGKNHHDTKSAANALWRCLIAQRELHMADELQEEYQLELKDVEIESRRDALLELSEMEKSLET